ncbi:MAG: SH3 domain-containing protein, partial [Xanthomarina sp.]
MTKFIFFITCFLFLNVIHAQETACLELYKEFKNGETAYLFGDNVRLRENPSTDSESLKLLKIGDRIEIIEKTTLTNTFQGMESPWYKVTHNKDVGYVLGGLISKSEVENNDLRCFINFEIMDDKPYIITRVLPNSNSIYFENKSAYLGDNHAFCITLFDNRGVVGIHNIIYINYLPESCAANSGGYYLFFDNKNLHKAMDLTSRGEYGYSDTESLYFPMDDLGQENKIIYISEENSYVDTLSEEDHYIWNKTSKF